MKKMIFDDRQKILIVAPHPDDEVLGCGGTIKRLSQQNNEVFVLIMSRGKKGMYSEERIHNVREEAKKAHELLGVTDTVFLDFPAPELDLVSVSELSRSISGVVKKFSPGIIFLPHRGDIHHDHKAVFNAGLVAARPGIMCPVKKVFSYETLSETELASPFGDDTFIPDFFVGITQSIESKIAAFKCFKSQIRNYPSSRSPEALEALAKLRGCSVGIPYAEAFMTIRIIEE